jgi:hypothetical protein
MATNAKVLGTVTSTVGEVKATASDGTVRILQVGDKVFADEVITTSAQGNVNIALESGRTLECGSDANLALNESILGTAVGAAAIVPATRWPDVNRPCRPRRRGCGSVAGCGGHGCGWCPVPAVPVTAAAARRCSSTRPTRGEVNAL